jgi:hypothetical protein
MLVFGALGMIFRIEYLQIYTHSQETFLSLNMASLGTKTRKFSLTIQ